MRRASILIIALAFVFIGLVRPVAAAPQILGLVAYNEAVPLNCAYGQCSAELITLCLQKHRDNPLPGTAYQFHGKCEATLVVTDAQGRQHQLAARDHLRVTTARSFTAVRVELTERKMRELGGVKVALIVSDGMSLVPEPKAGDMNPISPEEIDYTSAFLRVEADRWLHGTAPRTVAARIVNRMINNTPRTGRIGTASWQSIWKKGVNSEKGELRAAGREQAQEIFGACRYMVGDVGQFFSMRRCLETKHDSLMVDMNVDYWRAVTPDS